MAKSQDVVGKRFIIELFTPSSFNPITKQLYPLQINQALSMITTYSDLSKKLRICIKSEPREQSFKNNVNFFSDRKVSVVHAIKVLSKIGIETNEEQARDILDFLYLLAKTHHDQSAQHKQREGDF